MIRSSHSKTSNIAITPFSCIPAQYHLATGARHREYALNKTRKKNHQSLEALMNSRKLLGALLLTGAMLPLIAAPQATAKKLFDFYSAGGIINSEQIKLLAFGNIIAFVVALIAI